MGLDARRELTEEEMNEIRAAWQDGRALRETSIDFAVFVRGWRAHAVRVVPVSSEPGLGAKLDEMQLHDDTGDPLDVGYMRAIEDIREWLAARPVVEASGERWADDEWHTDHEGNVIGGAPPNFVFVAKATLVAASTRVEASGDWIVCRDCQQAWPVGGEGTCRCDEDHKFVVREVVVEASGEREAMGKAFQKSGLGAWHEDAFVRGAIWASTRVPDEAAALRNALEGAEEFLERVEKWSGTDPDEAHEVLATVQSALAASRVPSAPGDAQELLAKIDRARVECANQNNEAIWRSLYVLPELRERVTSAPSSSAPGDAQELGLPEGELLYRCESCGGLMSAASEPECGACGETMYAVEWPPRFTASSSSAPGICGVVCACGPNGEPLACGYEPHEAGPHSWATLPTFEGENA